MVNNVFYNIIIAIFATEIKSESQWQLAFIMSNENFKSKC